MYWTYMSDERRRDAAKRTGPFGMPLGEPPCGVAVRFLGITQVRGPRLAWRLARQHHSDAIGVNRP